ncbi:MAG: mechanosensitive ion channel family protein [Gammaproteobacteria bacterium]|nr:mechanosensitive ion channel family protein [Gammaproteobacteria bacterium]MDH3491120.1 mechanosensitive ion channel family protein [Gammaproteobacteria bacterium]
MNDILSNLNTLSLPWRLVAFAGLAVATHLIVIVLRQFGQRALSSQQVNRHQKLRSIATLTTSALVFTLYFLAVGLILREFGVSLTAYLASASVVGLAIGFGSQGIVQDVVTGLTFIFSDLVDVGDLVEISGQTGIVKAITMRFVELGNAMGATVFIPNRTINNVINYPRGYVRCIVDITLRGDDASRDAIEASALRLMSLVQQQFPGIQMREPSSEGRIKFDAGKEILRIKFRIWPNREKPIETTYFQELISEIKGIIPDYQPWMVSISYEVEKRVARAAKKWLWQS